jgi:hypothetical protein
MKSYHNKISFDSSGQNILLSVSFFKFSVSLSAKQNSVGIGIGQGLI